jgi:pimeloyl-ACP methyl ester carboxylesterase
MQTNKDLRSSSIKVDGASIYYDTIGSGPLFIPIPGANGTGLLYEPLAAALTHRFEVVLYDRRGYGKSHILTPSKPNMMARLKTHANDVVSLIQYLSPGKPVIVFATSGSGVLALELLQSRPDLVQRLILHEPLLLSPLPTSYKSDIKKKLRSNIRKYGGTENAKLRATLIPFIQGKWDQQRMGRTHQYARLQSQPADEVGLFYQYELPWVLDYEFDIGQLRPDREKLVLMKGQDISLDLTSGLMPLSKALGIPVIKAAGGHTGYVTDAEEFANKLLAALGCGKAKL